MSKQAMRRVLCFGDSLTQGWHLGGCGEHPYADTLSAEYGMRAEAHGFPGYTTSQLVGEAARVPGGGEDFVAILAGTNDLPRLGCVGDAAQTLQNLRRLYAWGAGRGARVCAVTIPPLSPDIPEDGVAAEREAVNAGIREEARVQGLLLVDFHDSLMAVPVAERQRLFDDYVHMSPAGYDMLGRAVGAALAAAK